MPPATQTPYQITDRQEVRMPRRDNVKPVTLYIDRRVYGCFKSKCFRRDRMVTDAINDAMTFWMRYGAMIEKVRKCRDPQKVAEVNARIVELEMLEAELEAERKAGRRKQPIHEPRIK